MTLIVKYNLRSHATIVGGVCVAKKQDDIKWFASKILSFNRPQCDANRIELSIKTCRQEITSHGLSMQHTGKILECGTLFHMHCRRRRRRWWRKCVCSDTEKLVRIAAVVYRVALMLSSPADLTSFRDEFQSPFHVCIKWLSLSISGPRVCLPLSASVEHDICIFSISFLWNWIFSLRLRFVFAIRGQLTKPVQGEKFFLHNCVCNPCNMQTAQTKPHKLFDFKSWTIDVPHALSFWISISIL